jgi:hypothetical protein
MERRRIGLTTLYNLVHDESVHDGDVVQLREIHQEIDLAVLDAYALDQERESALGSYEERVASSALPRWRDIDLDHGFHETPQGVRFTISLAARVHVLDKLLALNHYRHEQEVQQGLLSAKHSKGKGAAVAGGFGDVFDDGGLFRPEGALF